MKKLIILFLLYIISIQSGNAQIPTPALIGYWQNWNDINAPYIQLDQIDSRYTIIDVAFAIPHVGTDYQMEFIPDQVSPATLINQIQTLQSQGKKVDISIGGATAPISLDNISERDTFISTMDTIINNYGFDGIDIDFEGSSVSVTGGTIANPVDSPIINLIYAVKQIMHDYYISHNKHLLLTLAPETAFVQGGMSAYGSIWGAYLPVLDALRDSLDILHVQLYNSGSMYGIDGNIYSQGTADFIIAETEAVIHGFTTSGGMFTGLPANKIAVGLPACTNAAGGGFTDTTIVKAALDYLRGSGTQPGLYILTQPGGYPDLKGMMTWSINWDAVNTCASTYQYAINYENIFGVSASVFNLQQLKSAEVYPNPFTNNIIIKVNSIELFQVTLYDVLSRKILQLNFTSSTTVNTEQLSQGVYIYELKNKNGIIKNGKVIKQ